MSDHAELSEQQYQWLLHMPSWSTVRGQDVIDTYAAVAQQRDALLADKEGLSAICSKWEREYAALLAENQQEKARITWLEGEAEGWRTGLLAQTERLGKCEAECQRLRDALEHYADEDMWSADVGDVYTTFTYDGGEALPWKIARAALAAVREENE